MATKHTDSCLEKAGDDEPIFVLRSTDKLAPGLVRLWAAMVLRERPWSPMGGDGFGIADLLAFARAL